MVTRCTVMLAENLIFLAFGQIKVIKSVYLRRIDFRTETIRYLEH